MSRGGLVVACRATCLQCNALPLAPVVARCATGGMKRRSGGDLRANVKAGAVGVGLRFRCVARGRLALSLVALSRRSSQLWTGFWRFARVGRGVSLFLLLDCAAYLPAHPAAALRRKFATWIDFSHYDFMFELATVELVARNFDSGQLSCRWRTMHAAAVVSNTLCISRAQRLREPSSAQPRFFSSGTQISPRAGLARRQVLVLARVASRVALDGIGQPRYARPPAPGANCDPPARTESLGTCAYRSQRCSVAAPVSSSGDSTPSREKARVSARAVRRATRRWLSHTDSAANVSPVTQLPRSGRVSHTSRRARRPARSVEGAPVTRKKPMGLFCGTWVARHRTGTGLSRPSPGTRPPRTQTPRQPRRPRKRRRIRTQALRASRFVPGAGSEL